MFLHKGKRRRAQADFPGAEIILRQIKEKAKRKRVGLVSKGPPARGKEGVSWRLASTSLKGACSVCMSPLLCFTDHRFESCEGLNIKLIFFIIFVSLYWHNDLVVSKQRNLSAASVRDRSNQQEFGY